MIYFSCGSSGQIAPAGSFQAKPATDVLGAGVSAGLFLADQRIVLFRLGFEDGQRETVLVEQEVIHVAVSRFLEIVTQAIQVAFLQFDVGFQRDIGGTVLVVEEPPAGSAEEVVDQDSCFCFLRHAKSISLLPTAVASFRTDPKLAEPV